MDKSGTARDAHVRRDCLDNAYEALRGATPLEFLAIALVCILLRSSVGWAQLLTWSVIVALAVAVMAITARTYQRRRKADTVGDRWLPGHAAAAALGVAWGLLALIAMPANQHPAQQVFLLLIVQGVVSLATVLTSGDTQLFTWFIVPVVGLSIVGFARADDEITTAAISIILLVAVTMALIHRRVHRIVHHNLVTQHRATELVEDLRRQQERVAQSNLALLQTNDRLAHQASHDPLTGLGNRVMFLELLNSAVARAAREDAIVAVLFFDLDRFKVINDSLGHGAGDELLRAVALRVKRSLRAGDVFARLGGDEFTVALEFLRQTDDAKAVANNVLAAFTEPFEIDGRPLAVTPSIGLSLARGLDADADQLLRHADVALYRAKEAGRNRLEVFDDSLREQVAQRMDTEQDVRRGLRALEFEAWFQPEVDLATGLIVGAEALARWRHPTRGIVAAGQFIDLATQLGLAESLTERIIEQSVRFRVELDRLPLPRDFRIRMNITPQLVANNDKTAELVALLEREGCDPRGLTIEVTEQAVISELDVARDRLRTCRKLGFEISLDDFGTGYSSLAMLRQLPLDSIKIDRSFVSGVSDDHADLSIVQATIELAHHLGMHVVAEGVETEEQAATLLDLGCRRAQGYLFAAALSPQDFFARLVAQQAPELSEELASYHDVVEAGRTS